MTNTTIFRQALSVTLDKNFTFSFSFTSAEFSFMSKDKYTESRTQAQEKIYIKEEEESMGNEEYIYFGKFKKKTKNN